jgi:hypothetical protein
VRRLKMSWNKKGGRLVCSWIELDEREKCESCSVADRLRLSYNPGNHSTQPFTRPGCPGVFGLGRVA